MGGEGGGGGGGGGGEGHWSRQDDREEGWEEITCISLADRTRAPYTAQPRTQGLISASHHAYTAHIHKTQLYSVFLKDLRRVF